MSEKIFVNRSKGFVDFQKAEQIMLSTVKNIYDKNLVGGLWLLEHDHIYTGGTSAKDSDILNHNLAPILKTGRGGKFTYHGPGQRIIYTMLNLKKLHNKTPDIKHFINQLEDWIILTLKDLNIDAYKILDRVGLWVKKGNVECKIAAIGIRLSKWVSYHGIAINVSTNLDYFKGIIPCGLKNTGICSLKSLGINISFEEFDLVLMKNFYNIFKINLMDINETLSS